MGQIPAVSPPTEGGLSKQRLCPLHQTSSPGQFWGPEASFLPISQNQCLVVWPRGGGQ